MSIETINCGDSLRADNIEALYARLLLLLANGKQVSLDCSQLDYIDTAALQMLMAFSKEAAIHGQAVIWDKTNTTFLKQLRLLGLEQAVTMNNAEVV
jgi:anti-anti-sigma regulatory factor